MTNKVRAAHDALWTLVQVCFPTAEAYRNPAGHKKPAARAEGETAAYVALADDAAVEVLATLMGPIYDLQVCPSLLLAFSGKTKDERQQLAWAAVKILGEALEADRLLCGAVDYAEFEDVTPLDAGDTDWMAGGLEVRVRLLFSAPTRAG